MMDRSLFYDVGGHPIDRDQWIAEAEREPFHLNAYIVDRNNPPDLVARVSTKWFGLAHNMIMLANVTAAPLIFETLVFSDAPEWDRYSRWYATRDDATRGHYEIVHQITAPLVNLHVTHENRVLGP